MSVLKHDDKRKPIVCYCSLTNWKQAEKLRDFLWGCIVYALKQESLSRIKILIEQKQSSISCELQREVDCHARASRVRAEYLRLYS